MEEINLRKWFVIGTLILLPIVGAICFRSCCVTFVDNYELGYRYDLRTGQVSRVGRTGYVLHYPLIIKIHTVDLRPMQVCINANSRVLNCKLVQFNPDGLETFIAWHGRDNYDGGSASMSGSVTGSFNNILMSYAFDGSGKTYPFLTVIRELKPEESPVAASSGK